MSSKDLFRSMVTSHGTDSASSCRTRPRLDVSKDGFRSNNLRAQGAKTVILREIKSMVASQYQPSQQTALNGRHSRTPSSSQKFSNLAPKTGS